MDKKKEITVFIGRFSPFHNGHAEVLKRALETSQVVLVLVGSSGQARTTKNPFTFEERRQMITDYVRYLGAIWRPGQGGELIVEPIYDHPYNDNKWIEGVQAVVNRVKAENTSLRGLSNWYNYLTGSDRDATTWYLNAFGDFFEKDLITNHSAGLDLSATKIRDILFNTETLVELEVKLNKLVPSSTLSHLIAFVDHHPAYSELAKEYLYIERYKESYKLAPYPVSIQTVDACVINPDTCLSAFATTSPARGFGACRVDILTLISENASLTRPSVSSRRKLESSFQKRSFMAPCVTRRCSIIPAAASRVEL